MSRSKSWWTPPESPPNESLTEQDLTSQKLEDKNLPNAVEEDLPTRRIHILGLGSIGTLIASSLKQLPNAPPISLLMHRVGNYTLFNQQKRSIRLINKSTDVVDEQTGYDVDLLESHEGKIMWRYIPDQPPPDKKITNPLTEAEKMDSGETFIYMLIVTVKGPATQEALKQVRHRMNQRTTIMFLQNGLGQIDEINKYVFPDPATRPTYLIGVVSHGCYVMSTFQVVHAGAGTIALGMYRDLDKFPLPPKGMEAASPNLDVQTRRRHFPTDNELYANISARYLLRTVTRCPALACAVYPYLDLFQLQLEKLVVNCIVNPLTTLLDVKNGAMLNNPPLTRVQRLLLAEIATVIRGMPELEGIPNVRTRFSPTRLELKVQAQGTFTSQNSSSMREDMRLGRRTEVDYINGYVVKRGEQQGIKCVLNYMTMQLIKAKHHVGQAGEDAIKAAPYHKRDIKAERGRGSDKVILEDVGRADPRSKI